MNIELIAPKHLKDAEALIEQGGTKVAEGIALILISKADYASSGLSGGVNCADKLNAAIRLLKEDPYLAIGVLTGESATESDIKKGYRKFALKYHPDKTLNKTGLLFTVIQTAYDVLSDDEKRKAHDARVKRHKEKLAKMRAAKEAKEKRQAEKGKEDGSSLKTPSGNSFRQPPQSKDEASYRNFNKNFFKEFRKTHKPPPRTHQEHQNTNNAHKNRPPPPSSKPTTSASSTSTNKEKDKQPPPEAQSQHSSSSAATSRSSGLDGDVKEVTKILKLKATHRSDTTVTLSWAMVGENSHSTAFELQWRMQGNSNGTMDDWETSAQLILGNSCRKKNLNPGTCYAFRIRAASAIGWSKYCESVLVVTNNNHSRPSSASRHRSDKHPDKRPTDKKQQPASDNGTASSSDHADASSKKKAPPPKDMFKQNFSSAEAWTCSVCKRPNAPEAVQCSICYTKRSYVGKSSNSSGDGGDQSSKRASSQPYPNTARPSSANRSRASGTADRGYQSEGVPRRSAADDSDDEYDQEAWKFDAETDTAMKNGTFSFEIGDVVMTAGLSTKEYNGLMGEIRSLLVDSRHQVQLKLKQGQGYKDLRMKPENLVLKKRKRGNNTYAPKEAFQGINNSSSGNTNKDERSNSTNDNSQSSSGDLGGRDYRSGFPKIYYLNQNSTKLHNVRAEPILESRVVGSLLPNKQVLAMAEVGDWLKVEWHIKNEGQGAGNRKSSSFSSDTGGNGSSFGWCLYKDSSKKISFLVEDSEYVEDNEEWGNESGDETSNSRQKSANSSKNSSSNYYGVPNINTDMNSDDMAEEVIYELRDAAGDLYYFNGYTGVSCWDPPEWIDSIDPVSGACYYENTLTGETQWETPFDFIPVVREEAYSTPEAEFIKSVLSPKRSRGAGKFYTPDEA